MNGCMAPRTLQLDLPERAYPVWGDPRDRTGLASTPVIRGSYRRDRSSGMGLWSNPGRTRESDSGPFPKTARTAPDIRPREREYGEAGSPADGAVRDGCGILGAELQGRDHGPEGLGRLVTNYEPGTGCGDTYGYRLEIEPPAQSDQLRFDRSSRLLRDERQPIYGRPDHLRIEPVHRALRRVAFSITAHGRAQPVERDGSTIRSSHERSIDANFISASSRAAREGRRWWGAPDSRHGVASHSALTHGREPS